MYSEEISVYYKTSSVDFKRTLISVIKKHPKVWNESKEVDDDWEIIRKEMVDMCTIKQLQTIWSTLRSLYFQTIFIRTIERNFEAPQWSFFHDMTFMYASVKEEIQEKLGGISPPLFKPSSNQMLSCPCCEHVVESDSKSVTQIDDKIKKEIKLEDEIVDSKPVTQIDDEIKKELKLEDEIGTVALETVLENDNAYEYFDENFFVSEDELSTSSKWESEEEESNSLEPQQNESNLIELPRQEVTFDGPKEDEEIKTELASPDPSSEIPQTQDNDFNEIAKNENLSHCDSKMDDFKADPIVNDTSFEKNELDNLNIQMLETRLENDDSDSFDFDEVISTSFKSESEEQSNSSESEPNPTTLLDLPIEDVEKEKTSDGITEILKDKDNKFESPSLHNNADDNHTSINMPFPVHLIKTSNPVIQYQSKDASSIQEKKLTYIRSTNIKHIDIKSKRRNQSQIYRTINRLELIEAIKANPITYDTSLQTNRKTLTDAWERISMQLLGRLSVHSIKNRWAWIKNQYLKELVYERYSTGQKKSFWEFFKDMEFLRPFMQSEINELHYLRLKMKETVKKNQESLLKNAPPEPDPDRLNVDSVSKTYCRQPKPKVQPPVLDPSTMPILQNRPIKIKVVQVPSSIDLPNDERENLKTNCSIKQYLPPPAKKLKLSSEFEERLPSPTNVSKSQVSTPEPLQLQVRQYEKTVAAYIDIAAKKQTRATYQLTQLPNIKITPKILNSLPQKLIPIQRTASQFVPKIQKTVSEIPTRQPVPINFIPVIRTPIQTPASQTGRPVVSNSIFLNRSVKITPISVVPTLGINNAGGGGTSAYKDITRTQGLPINMGNEEIKDKRPLKVVKVKKLRKILPASSAPAPSPPVTSLTHDLTDKSQKHGVPHQKVFPPLDLTLEDELHDVSSTPALKTATEAFNNTHTVRPTLDLTADEEKDAVIEHQDTGRRKNNKDDNNVICVDDDNDSVSSFDEVIVYLSEQIQNETK
ncbi:uncharacterized protein LOC129919387 [Episyrphus balteatus]|uniref:uncharacterized protein LOC129919387 n=1 Tax=Episyrphus balteatus TaxID=286459 RepID=UPI00248558EC|nr:uncharacterized protein LOC129919387 [Episyrphus balteatus]